MAVCVLCVCVLCVLCVCVCVHVTSSRWQRKAMSWRRQLVKLGQFMRAWLVLCRQMFLYTEHLWSQLQLPFSGKYYFRHNFDSKTNAAQRNSQHGPPLSIPLNHYTPWGPLALLAVSQDNHHGLWRLQCPVHLARLNGHLYWP